MSYRWMSLLLLAAGCTFDTGGSSTATADARITNTLPDAGAIDARGDDWIIDAGDECVDEDGDGFFRAVAPGAMCGPADCDDSNEAVFPGQSGAFTTPKASGDFDYNYDGVDEPLSDTRSGDDCHADPFGPCEGTGWVGRVPGCGEGGTWHRCEWGVFTCDETERVDAVMPCV